VTGPDEPTPVEFEIRGAGPARPGRPDTTFAAAARLSDRLV